MHHKKSSEHVLLYTLKFRRKSNIHFIYVDDFLCLFTDSLKNKERSKKKRGKNGTIDQNHVSCHQNYEENLLKRRHFYLLNYFIRMVRVKIQHLFCQTNADSISVSFHQFTLIERTVDDLCLFHIHSFTFLLIIFFILSLLILSTTKRTMKAF